MRRIEIGVRLLVLLVLLVLAPPLHAQTVSLTMAWDFLNTLLVEVQTYTTTLSVDGGAAVTLTPTCLAVLSDSKCQAPIVVPPGNHLLRLTVTNPAGLSTFAVLNLSAPATPQHVRIVP